MTDQNDEDFKERQKYDVDRFNYMMSKLLEEAKQYESSMSLYVDEESNSVQLIVDPTCSYYGEWIKGEGADIAILRDQLTNRVVGVTLPLYTDRLCVFHTGPLMINDGFKKDKNE